MPSHLKEYVTQNQMSCLNRNWMKPLYKSSWDDIEASENPDEAYKNYLISFLIYTILTFLKNRLK